MGIFIDTGIFIAARNKSEKTNTQALKILKEVQTKKYGEIYTSDYVFDESIILMGVRTKLYSAMRDVGTFILQMPNLNLKFTDAKTFKMAWDIHEKYSDRLLSFTDATIIALCQILHIDTITTVDNHFNGIIKSILQPI